MREEPCTAKSILGTRKMASKELSWHSFNERCTLTAKSILAYKDETIFLMPENDQSNIDILVKRESHENKLHDQKEYASQFPLTNVLTPINIRFYSSLSIGSFSRN